MGSIREIRRSFCREFDVKKFLTTLSAVAVLATGFTGTMSGAASADDYRYRRHHGYYDRGYDHHRRNNTGEILGAGAIGLAAGALLGGALASDPYDRRVINEGPIYNEGPVNTYRRVPARSYRGYDHVSACAARYRTYDSRSDTFIGNDGYAHACRL